MVENSKYKTIVTRQKNFIKDLEAEAVEKEEAY